MSETLKVSEEWYREYPDITIIDPDGWDRSNYQYSWYKEKISKKEFERRMNLSTSMRAVAK